MKHIIVAALVLVSSAALGADKRDEYSIQGGASCRTFITELQEKSLESVVIGAWMAGFISAFNSMAPDTFNILGSSDMKDVELWMENYCRRSPLKNVGKGMIELTNELYPRRYKTAKEAGK